MCEVSGASESRRASLQPCVLAPRPLSERRAVRSLRNTRKSITIARIPPGSPDSRSSGIDIQNNRLKEFESTDDLFYPSRETAERAHVRSMEQYRSMYLRSVNDPGRSFTSTMTAFLLSLSFRIVRTFLDPRYDRARVGKSRRGGRVAVQFRPRRGRLSEQWSGAKTNLAYNLSRNSNRRRGGDRLALIFEANDAIKLDDVYVFANYSLRWRRWRKRSKG